MNFSEDVATAADAVMNTNPKDYDFVECLREKARLIQEAYLRASNGEMDKAYWEEIWGKIPPIRSLLKSSR